MGDANHEILKIPALGCDHRKQLHAFIKGVRGGRT